MKKIYEINMEIKSAVHINAGTRGDGRQITVKSNGEMYIPATVIKGVVRNNMEGIIKALQPDYKCCGKENVGKSCDCIMCKFFGKAGFQPSRIIIDNLYNKKNDIQMELRTNNGISRYNRRTQEGALVTSEAISTAGDILFSGVMTVYYTKELEKYENILLKSFTMVDSIGSGKSRGLGRVKVTVTCEK